MSRNAPVSRPIHELLERRWSPCAFDADRGVSEEDVSALFEAARWAMSSYNAQPWRYVVASRERQPEVWEKLFSVLVEGNQPWAKNAPVLALGCIEHNFEHNGKPNKAAAHDLGAASAFLSIEATVRGLSVHQMIGIDVDKVHDTFGIGGSLEPLTALAIGYVGDPSLLPEAYASRDTAERRRKPASEFIIEGGF